MIVIYAPARGWVIEGAQEAPGQTIEDEHAPVVYPSRDILKRHADGQLGYPVAVQISNIRHHDSELRTGLGSGIVHGSEEPACSAIEDVDAIQGRSVHGNFRNPVAGDVVHCDNGISEMVEGGIRKVA